jgi:hypothetical protein
MRKILLNMHIFIHMKINLKNMRKKTITNVLTLYKLGMFLIPKLLFNNWVLGVIIKTAYTMYLS